MTRGFLILLFVIFNSIKWIVFGESFLEWAPLWTGIGSAVGIHILFASPAIWLNRKAMILYFFAMTLLGSMLMEVDIIYARYFDSLPSIAELRLSRSVIRPLLGIAMELVRPIDVIVFLDAAIWLLLAVRPSMDVSPSNVKRRMVVTIGLTAAGLALLSGATKTAKIDYQRRYKVLEVYGSRAMAASLGVVGFHLYDVFLNLHVPRDVSAEEMATVEEVMRGRTQASSGDSGVARGMNVVMILGESWLGFTLGYELDGQEITPCLNRLGARSIVRGMLYDVTGAGATSDATFALLNSLLPLNNEPIPYRYQGNAFRALPRILAESGYRTIMATVAEPDVWNMRRIDARYGFEETYFAEDWGDIEKIGPWGIGDREFFEESVDRIANGDSRPFFALLVPSTSHYPFQLPETERRLSIGAEMPEIVRDYLDAIHYFDRSIGGLLEDLDERGLADSTVIVVFGDHGVEIREELRELPDLAADSRQFERIVRMTGLVFFVPGMEGRIRRNLGPVGSVGSLLDLAPTLLSLTGIAREKEPMLGRDWTTAESGVVVFPNGSATDGRHLAVPSTQISGAFSCRSLVDGDTIDPAGCATLGATAKSFNVVSRIIVTGDLLAGGLAW